jgi:hypothetical protein
MFKTLVLSALFAVSLGAFTASAHAEIDDYSFDIEQILNISGR